MRQDPPAHIGDACRIAHALDLVGDRWSLLIVRELILGPKRFTDLSAGLPHATADMLTRRLRDLEDGQVVVKRRRGAPVRRVGLRAERVGPGPRAAGDGSRRVGRALAGRAARPGRHQPGLAAARIQGPLRLRAGRRTLTSRPSSGSATRRYRAGGRGRRARVRPRRRRGPGRDHPGRSAARARGGALGRRLPGRRGEGGRDRASTGDKRKAKRLFSMFPPLEQAPAAR